MWLNSGRAEARRSTHVLLALSTVLSGRRPESLVYATSETGEDARAIIELELQRHNMDSRRAGDQ